MHNIFKIVCKLVNKFVKSHDYAWGFCSLCYRGWTRDIEANYTSASRCRVLDIGFCYRSDARVNHLDLIMSPYNFLCFCHQSL
jgi:hypothetical protein